MNRLTELQYDIYPKMSYQTFIDSVAHHIEGTIEEVDGIPYLLTVTFASARTPDLDTMGKITPRSARSILSDFEYCYGCLMDSKKLLGNSYERKHHLQPLTYAFADFSYTKGSSSDGFSDRAQGSRVDEREPGANAHLHCIMVVHPHTRENLESPRIRGSGGILQVPLQGRGDGGSPGNRGPLPAVLAVDAAIAHDTDDHR